jgi:hypothetical protein
VESSKNSMDVNFSLTFQSDLLWTIGPYILIYVLPISLQHYYSSTSITKTLVCVMSYELYKVCRYWDFIIYSLSSKL